MYSEYHNILATMIQRKWRKFILQKKLRNFIKPTENSLKLKEDQCVLLNKTFNRIHHNTTYFKTMVVKYDLITVIRNIEITYKSDNCYTIYDLDNQVVYDCDKVKVLE